MEVKDMQKILENSEVQYHYTQTVVISGFYSKGWSYSKDVVKSNILDVIWSQFGCSYL